MSAIFSIISLDCLHDTFHLRCPVCGNPFWDRKARFVKCRDCGGEVMITEDKDRCRLTLVVQGA